MDPAAETSNPTQERDVDANVGGVGVSVMDEKGRISFPKRLRQLLGAEPGSSIAYIALDHALLLIPQDEHLTRLQQRANDTLARGGLTAQDLQEQGQKAPACKRGMNGPSPVAGCSPVCETSALSGRLHGASV
jgi:bifunctional DNA-binding transcriptional regulator/antitoxin component of YhaV-PrlF toxin-antitoxin module